MNNSTDNCFQNFMNVIIDKLFYMMFFKLRSHSNRSVKLRIPLRNESSSLIHYLSIPSPFLCRDCYVVNDSLRFHFNWKLTREDLLKMMVANIYYIIIPYLPNNILWQPQYCILLDLAAAFVVIQYKEFQRSVTLLAQITSVSAWHTVKSRSDKWKTTQITV